MKSKGLERQKEFLDGLASTPIPCFSCKGSHRIKDVAENYAVTGWANQTCPVTKERIQDQIGLFGGERYFSVKEKGSQ